MATRVAIVSDTHLRDSSRLPREVSELIAGADLAIHAGDISSAEVLDEMAALGTPLSAVCGNVDSAEVRARVPEQVAIRIEEVEFAVIHDAGAAKGRLARLRRRFPGAGVVIFGHSHMPLHETEGDFQIFNPGSPTQRRRAPRHTMGIARVSGSAARLELIALTSRE